MICPKCGSQQDKVNDSRPQDEGERVWRRRHCTGCRHRYTTTEISEARYEELLKAEQFAGRIASCIREAANVRTPVESVRFPQPLIPQPLLRNRQRGQN